MTEVSMNVQLENSGSQTNQQTTNSTVSAAPVAKAKAKDGWKSYGRRIYARYTDSRVYKILSGIAKAIRWLIAVGLFGLSCLFIINGLVIHSSDVFFVNDTISTAWAFVTTILLILVLGFLEGLEVSVLSIQLASPDVWNGAFKGKYPRAADVHKLTSGANSNRILSFVLGRQVLVTLVVFALSLFTQFNVFSVGDDPSTDPVSVNGVYMEYFPWDPSALIPGSVKIFFEQGLVSVIVIACAGQLAPQIVAAAYPVQFCNMPFAWTMTQLCILVDEIGLTYFAWVEAKIVEVIFRLNRDINSKLQEGASGSVASMAMTPGEERFVVEPKPAPLRRIATVFRYIWSSALVLFAACFVFPGIVNGNSGFSSTFPNVPGWVCLIIFLLMLGLLWILEGSQVALVNLARHSDEVYKDKYPRAASVRKMVANEKSIGAYLIGRQLCTVTTVFFAANLTHLNMTTYPGTDWAVDPTFASIFLSSGFLGQIITTLAGQLTPRLLCADFPVQTLSIPGFPIVIWVCRAVEFLGIGHFAWILFYLYTFNLDSSVTDKMGIKKSVIDSKEELDEIELANVTKAEWKELNEKLFIQDQKLNEILDRLDSVQTEKSV